MTCRLCLQPVRRITLVDEGIRRKVKIPNKYAYSEEGRCELGKHDADVGANSVLDDLNFDTHRVLGMKRCACQLNMVSGPLKQALLVCAIDEHPASRDTKRTLSSVPLSPTLRIHDCSGSGADRGQL